MDAVLVAYLLKLCRHVVFGACDMSIVEEIVAVELAPGSVSAMLVRSGV